MPFSSRQLDSFASVLITERWSWNSTRKMVWKGAKYKWSRKNIYIAFYLSQSSFRSEKGDHFLGHVEISIWKVFISWAKTEPPNGSCNGAKQSPIVPHIFFYTPQLTLVLDDRKKYQRGTKHGTSGVRCSICEYHSFIMKLKRPYCVLMKVIPFK